MPLSSQPVPSEAEILAMADPLIVAGLGTTLTPHLDSEALDALGVRELDERIHAGEEPDPAVIPAPDIVHVQRNDGTSLVLRVHRPPAGGTAAVVLWIHGGGMFLGSAEADDQRCRMWSDATGMAVVAVDYRLAPEHPYPAPLDDCYTALEWLAFGADDLLDPERIIVYGGSAGGGLAIGLALLARDRGLDVIRQVQAIYPMLDDREITGSQHQLQNAPVWNRRLNRVGWDAYLGQLRSDPPIYAAPARAEDLSRLPPFLIDTAEFDLFRDEDIEFAMRLFNAGVRCELHVEPGTTHGFDGISPDAGVSRRAWERRHVAAERAIGR